MYIFTVKEKNKIIKVALKLSKAWSVNKYIHR